jgi:hypothetical protein
MQDGSGFYEHHFPNGKVRDFAVLWQWCFDEVVSRMCRDDCPLHELDAHWIRKLSRIVTDTFNYRISTRLSDGTMFHHSVDSPRPREVEDALRELLNARAGVVKSPSPCKSERPIAPLILSSLTYPVMLPPPSHEEEAGQEPEEEASTPAEAMPIPRVPSQHAQGLDSVIIFGVYRDAMASVEYTRVRIEVDRRTMFLQAHL